MAVFILPLALAYGFLCARSLGAFLEKTGHHGVSVVKQDIMISKREIMEE